MRHHIAWVVLLVAFLVGAASEHADASATFSPAGPISPTVDMPRSASFNSSGSYLAVAGSSGSLSRYAIPRGGALESLGPSTQCAGSSVAFKPTGNILASVNTEADTVALCSVSSGNGSIVPLGSPMLTGEEPIGVEFSPDGRFLVTTNRDDGSISMFSVGATTLTPVNNGEPFFIGFSNPNTRATSATFSPDGRFLLVTSGCRIGPSLMVFAVSADGLLNEVYAIDPPGLRCFVNTSFVGTTSEFIAVAADSLGSQTDLLTYSLDPTGEIEESTGTSPSGPGPVDLAVSPDGKLVAYTNFQENRLTLLRRAVNGELSPAMSVSPGDGPSSVAFGAGGTLLSVTTEGDDSVELYHLAPGPTLLPAGAPKRLEGMASFLAVSPTGRIAVTTQQQDGAELFLLDSAGFLARTGKLSPGGVTDPHGAAFSTDGKRLAIASDNGLSTYTVSLEGAPIYADSAVAAGVPSRVAFSLDGTLIATASYSDNSVSLFSIAPDGALTSRDSIATSAGPRSLSFSPDGSLLVTANSLGGDINVFGVSGTTLSSKASISTGGTPVGVAFRPTGGQFAVAEHFREQVSTYAINANGQVVPLGSGYVENAEWVAWSPSGDMLAAVGGTDNLGRPGNLRTFSVSEAGMLKQFGDLTSTDLNPSGVAFDASGRFILVSQSLGRTVWVYPLAAPVLDTVIATAPAAYDNQDSPWFGFDASYPSLYECQLDNGSFASCESSSIQIEADGPHTLAVRARDPVGNVDPTPATHSWIRDTTPPSAAAPITPLDGAANLAPTTTFSWEPSADELSGVDRYELLVKDGARTDAVYLSTCGATCTVVMPGLANGAHTWTVRARDLAGNTSESAVRPFSVDAEPPGLASLLSPTGGVVVGSARPTLSWLPAIDGGSGVDHYEASVDGQSFSPTAATSIQIPTALADGAHIWSLVAVDRAGNQSPPTTATFRTDTTSPVARLAAGPKQTLPGVAVVLDAHESTDLLGAIADFSWDTNGDGVFDRNTGRSAQTTTTFPAMGTYHLAVQVTDEAGLTSSASVDVTITSAGAGVLGQGAGVRFIPPKATGSRVIKLVLTPPVGARAARISNDDDPNQTGIKHVAFDSQAAKTTDWVLDPQTSPGKETKQVFVWFERGTELVHTSPTIILDELAPDISSATFSPSRKRTGKRRTVVRVKASDHRGTGIKKVRVSPSCSGPFKPIKSKPRNDTYTIRASPFKSESKVRVTVLDSVGNSSRCVTARRPSS